MAGFDGRKKLIATVAVSVFAVAAVAAGVITGVIPHTSTAPEAPAISSAPPPASPAPVAKQAPAKSHPAAGQTAGSRAASPPSPAPSFESCVNCGVVQSIESFTEKGQATGGGAVAGGLLGGILGHQIGQGRGKDLATVAGAVGGAIAGNEIEKNTKKVTRYHVAVRMNDGTAQIFTLNAAPSLAVGDRVVIVNGVPRRE